MSDTSQPTLPNVVESNPWTSSEIATLRRLADQGAQVVAAELGRSVNSVKQMAKRQRLSLRRRGSRSGLLLGQPRGKSWLELRHEGITTERLKAIREDALSGDVDLTTLEAQIVAIAKGREPELCPQCATRYVQRAASGLCAPCHLRILSRLHQDAVDTRNAERQLWAARQENSRDRRRDDFDPA
jgi:hypothetical protein